MGLEGCDRLALGLFVDWKDTDAFIAAIDELSARWNLRIDWGGDLDDEEFSSDLSVPDLMAVAFDRLREHGYSLWNWNTGGDAYAGWIALSRDDDAMLTLTSLLGWKCGWGTRRSEGPGFGESGFGNRDSGIAGTMCGCGCVEPQWCVLPKQHAKRVVAARVCRAGIVHGPAIAT